MLYKLCKGKERKLWGDYWSTFNTDFIIFFTFFSIGLDPAFTQIVNDVNQRQSDIRKYDEVSITDYLAFCLGLSNINNYKQMFTKLHCWLVILFVFFLF